MTDLDKLAETSPATSHTDYRGAQSETEGATREILAALEQQLRSLRTGLSTVFQESWVVTDPVSPATSPTEPWVVGFPHMRSDFFRYIAQHYLETSHAHWRLGVESWLLRRPRRKILIPASIRIAGTDGVLDLISDHPELDAVITEAYRRLSDLFGASQFVLQGTSHPEPTDPGDQSIVLSVQTTLNPTEAAQRLDRFDSEWWLDRPPAVRALLIVSVDFA